jgi:hypothetical protein
MRCEYRGEGVIEIAFGIIVATERAVGNDVRTELKVEETGFKGG